MSLPDSMQIKKGRGRPRIIRIPESFQCLGHTVEVRLVDNQELMKQNEKQGVTLGLDESLYGLYDHAEKIIYLSTEQSQSSLEQIWFHELVHCILEHTGNSDLSDDETFVDLTAEVLYQILKTLKFTKASK